MAAVNQRYPGELADVVRKLSDFADVSTDYPFVTRIRGELARTKWRLPILRALLERAEKQQSPTACDSP